MGYARGHGGVPEGSEDKRTETRKRKGKEIFILSIKYLTKSVFRGFILKWISLKTWLKGLFVAQTVILTGKRSLKRQKIKDITKEKEKKRQENQKNEVIKRKGKNKNKKRKEKKKKICMGNRQTAVDKS